MTCRFTYQGKVYNQDSLVKALQNMSPEHAQKYVPNLNYLPDMPFKQTEQWAGLALKHMIQKAVEENKSRISWTPGEAQAARYDLSKHIDEIKAYEQHDGTYDLIGLKKGGGSYHTFGKNLPKEKLADYIGKDAAEKLFDNFDGKTAGGNTYKLSGLQLKVGGEGMKGFYDQMLPKIVEKLGKQYGVKVKEGGLAGKDLKYRLQEFPGYDNAGKIYEIRTANEPRETGLPDDGKLIAASKSKEAAEEHLKSLPKEDSAKKVHYFDIPPKMREDVLKKGFPLFSDTGVGGPLSALEHIKDNQGNSYRLEKEVDNLGRYHYKVFDSKQPYVPAAMVDLKQGNQKAMYLGTRNDLRRQGLMSALHDHIEKDIGHGLEKDWATTPDGEAFYQNRQNNKQQIERPIEEGKTEPKINVPERAAGGRVLASNIDANPSEAQKHAGNYKKDHINLWGLNITIENAKNSIRRGIGPDGKAWAAKLPCPYGYLKNTNGADNDHLDVYIGPHTKSDKVFVINQVNEKTKEFDETKSLLGFGSLHQALTCYKKAFSDGKGAERIGSIVSTDIKHFKEWVKSSSHHKPFKSAA